MNAGFALNNNGMGLERFTTPQTNFMAPALGTVEKKDNTGAIVTGVLLVGAVGATWYLVNQSDKPAKKLAGPSFAKEAGMQVLKTAVPWVVGAGLVLYVGNKLLQKVGIVDSKEDKSLDRQAENSTSQESPWNSNYYKRRGATIDTTSAERVAKQLYDADGYFNDDEPAVYAALKSLQYKTNLSRVVEVFANKYGKDLYSYLDGANSNGFLDASEMIIVNNIVNALK